MAVNSVFTKLRDLDEMVEKTNIIEEKVEEALNRDRKEKKNILQCPQDSLTAIHDTKSQLKKMSDGALRILSNLQMIRHSNQKLLNDADKIFEYLTMETDKMETHLKKLGYVPPAPKTDDSSLDISQSKERSKSSTTEEQKNESGNLEAELPEDESEKEQDPLALPKSPEVPDIMGKNMGISYLVSPEAPPLYQNDNEMYKLPPISAGRFQPNTAGLTSEKQPKGGSSHLKTEFFPQLPESPNSPDLNIQHGKYNTHTVEAESEQSSNNIARKKFFETPRAKIGRETATTKSSQSVVQNYTSDAPYFAVLNQLPQSPTLTNTNADSHCNDGHKPMENAPNMDTPDSPDVDFKIYGRKSIGLLDESPGRLPSPDDITVLLLGGKKSAVSNGTFALAERSPDSPDLTDYSKRLPYTRYDDQLPDTPPSPDLTSYKTYKKQGNIKENIDPTDGSDCSLFKIKEGQYEDLPSYLKRLISYELGCECARKIIENTFSLPGEKYTHVITKSKIEEVTCLGGKTKSFIFMMTTLKIMKKISGTDYFEITV